MIKRWLGLSALSLGATLAGTAHADGGYFSGVKGARSSGRGGAFTARADDVTAVGINPAGLTHVDGTVIQVGNRFSYNEHTFQRNPTLDWGVSGGGTPPYVEFAPVGNKTPWQVLDPFLGVKTSFGLKDWAFALAAYSPAGTARVVYPEEGGQRYMMVRRNAQIIDYNLSAAWKHDETFGFGASLQWIAVPTLEYSLVIDGNPYRQVVNPVTSGFDIRANVKGDDLFTLNAILGAWVRPVKELELGVSGQILPSEIKTNSKLTVAFVHPDPDNQIELKRGTAAADDANLVLPMPITVRLGARYRHLEGDEERFDIELDGVYETWSNVDRFRLDSHGIYADYRGEEVPVGIIDVPKNWHDTIGIHLGGDYRLVKNLATLRAGLYYETPVADPGYSNIDFADGPQLGGALGASLFLGKHLEIALTTEYRGQPEVSISDRDARVYQQAPGSPCKAPYTDPNACNAQYLGMPAAPINGGTYDAYSLVASLEGTYRF